MYSVCQTIHPNSTVEHSVECKFYNNAEKNLILAGANQIRVYRIADQSRLEFRQSFELHGTVASLQRVTLGNKHASKRDSLVISFHDAKLSIVEYNPDSHDLKTVSMHYFEDDTLRDGYVTNHMYPPIVRVDPEDRCISMLIYGRHVVVIPLDKDEEEGLENDLYNTSSASPSSVNSSIEDESFLPYDQSIQNPANVSGQIAALKPAVMPSIKSPILPSYKLDLSLETCAEKFENIVDIQFLHNYNDPTLVILFEPARTWSGRIAMRQDTFSMVALSLNIHQRLQPIIWTVNNLPYDCLGILPVPKPIGGLLVIACNELIYLNQSVPAYGTSFNSFTRDSSSFPLDDPLEEIISAKRAKTQINQQMIKMEVKMEVEDNDSVNLYGHDNNSKDGIQDDKMNNISSSTTSNSNINNNNNSNNIDKHDISNTTTTKDKNDKNGDCPTSDDKKNQEVDYMNISLDLSQAVFLNHNKILFVLKDGHVYLVTLFNDDMRSIKNFHFELIASTVQPNCLTLCENNLLFIGSHVGDSVLVEIVGDLNQADRQAAYDGDDLDSLISTEEKEPICLKEHDKLMSTSACGRICYGEAPCISDSLNNDYREPFIELLATSGHHKNGAVCVFQRTIKPNVDDTYELKNCAEIWTLKASKQSDPANSRLLLNREFETMVFSTKGELLELKRDQCAFQTKEPTVFACNIGQDNLTLQIMSDGAQLISNDISIDQVKIEGKVIDACVADPHIVVMTSSNIFHHLELKYVQQYNEMQEEPTTHYGLICHEIGPLAGGSVVATSLFKDTTGMFSCESRKRAKAEQSRAPSYWLFAVDDRGVLEVFSLPEFSSVYSVDNFPSSPSILVDNTKLFVTDLDTNLPKTKEILMCCLSDTSSKPMLLVRTDFELIIYEAYSYRDVDISNHLKIRFRKIDCLLIDTISPLDLQPYIAGAGEQTLAITDGRNRGGHGASAQHHQYLPRRPPYGQPINKERTLQARRHMTLFRSIGQYDGVFLAGERPHWFIMTQRGQLRQHPMTVEGAIYGFSQHDADSFIYYNDKRELRIARLPARLDLDAHWLTTKFPMQETVHFVNYHVDRKIYCVVTSTPNPCFKIMKVGSEPDTMKIENLEREHGYIPPMTEQFRLRLYDPENWEPIPGCEIKFEEYEQVTCVRNVQLASEGTKSGLKGYIAISTNYCYGEDVPNRGKIWILDLIEVVPEPDQPLTRNKIKKVYCQEQKGPVTTLSHCCGLLMSAVGQKIYLWQLKEEQLDGVAFIDTQIYIHCASSVKNLILVSDVCKSVTLLRFQQETRTLSMVCRDSRSLEVFACDFIVNNELLNFIVSDSEKNILIYAHDPENPDSLGATRLVRRADYHLGSHVTTFCRLRSRVPSLTASDPGAAYVARRRHITMFATVDGAVGFVLPIDEAAFRRLQVLQNEISRSLPHTAGLNPKAWRTIKHARPSLATPCKLIIDGDLVRKYLVLPAKERFDMARKVGASIERILADIQIVQESTLYF